MFLLLVDGDDDGCFNVECYSCLVMSIDVGNAYIHAYVHTCTNLLCTVQRLVWCLSIIVISLLLRRTMSMLIDSFND